MTPVELVDSHAHFDFVPSGDPQARAALLERAQKAGVVQIVAIGGGRGLDGNRDVLELARTTSGIFPTIGVHPHDVAQVPADFVAQVAKWAARPEVVAVGEIGLDYYYDHSARAEQQRAFREQLEVARAVHKPVVIHTRDADDDTARLLREGRAEEVGGVIHCFTAGPALARAALDLGFDISVSGIVTFKNAGPLREVVKTLPLDRLLVETDSPFLAPVPHRGKPNEPAFVRHVAEALATLLGRPFDEVAAATTANARRRFRLGQSRLGEGPLSGGTR
jgi:TatD DNase family protein